jgi:hypothetical protein
VPSGRVGRPQSRSNRARVVRRLGLLLVEQASREAQSRRPHPGDCESGGHERETRPGRSAHPRSAYARAGPGEGLAARMLLVGGDSVGSGRGGLRGRHSHATKPIWSQGEETAAARIRAYDHGRSGDACTRDPDRLTRGQQNVLASRGMVGGISQAQGLRVPGSRLHPRASGGLDRDRYRAQQEVLSPRPSRSEPVPTQSADRSRRRARTPDEGSGSGPR